MLTQLAAHHLRRDNAAYNYVMYAVCYFAPLLNSSAAFDIAMDAFCGMAIPALPDYTARPSDEDATRYARSMFVDGACDDGDGWRCGTIVATRVEPSSSYALAVDVVLTFEGRGDGEEIGVTVWYETRDDGSRYLYGEW